MSKVLITDALSEEGLKILRECSEVIYEPGMKADKIKEVIKDCSAMLVRSGTQVTKEIIDACSSEMKIIGRAGVGVDNIDVEAATQKGIIVVNSPDGNTTAAAEHTFALMMSLARFIPNAHESMKKGEWERKKFTGIELRNKNLGIIGLGKIGSKVAQMAQGACMKVYAFDPMLSREKAESLNIELVDNLDEIWTNCDFISLHVPKTPKTANLINKDSIAKMKDGVRIINCSRGGVVNEADLADAVEKGKVAGAAIDVYDKEPPDKDHPLLRVADKIIMTPHLGAATEEAQINVAIDVALQIKEVLTGGFVSNAVNISGINSATISVLAPYMNLCRILGCFLAQYAGQVRIENLTVKVNGELAKQDIEPLILSSLIGFLSSCLEGVTLVNVKSLAKERNIKITESKLSEKTDYSEEISLELQTDNKKFYISGILENKKIPVIIKLNGRSFFLVPSEHMLLTLHNDRPGVIAKIGSVLANNNINISGMALGRKGVKEEALMICSIDETISDNVLEEIKKASYVEKAAYIKLKL